MLVLYHDVASVVRSVGIVDVNPVNGTTVIYSMTLTLTCADAGTIKYSFGHGITPSLIFTGPIFVQKSSHSDYIDNDNGGKMVVNAFIEIDGQQQPTHSFVYYIKDTTPATLVGTPINGSNVLFNYDLNTGVAYAVFDYHSPNKYTVSIDKIYYTTDGTDPIVGSSSLLTSTGIIISQYENA